MIEDLNMEEFLARFETEQDCVDYLFHVKWPNGFVCPRCDHQDYYQINSRRLPLFECCHCHHQTSLTVGTVMEGSRTALRKWLMTLFLVSCTSRGINAVQLSKKINVTYKTAWLMLHKIRHAMNEADASVPLSGLIHVNDAFYGRRPQSSLLRSPHEHPLLVGASMKVQDAPVYLKIKLVPKIYLEEKFVLDAGKEHFVQTHVEPTPAHIEFSTGPYKPIKHKKLYPFFIKAKRWINDTFHGLGPRHLNSYLNEFCYRLNQKSLNSDIFSSLSHLCMACTTISYAALTA